MGRRGVSVAAAVALLAAASSACGGSNGNAAGSGAARVVALPPADSADIARVTVTVSKGEGTSFAPRAVNLSGSSGAWVGYVSAIPAGTGRQFDVVAYDAASRPLATGSGKSDIRPGAAALIVIQLQGVVPPPPGNSLPVIDSVAASQYQVMAGVVVQMRVTAHDPDPADTISYRWDASCGAYDTPASPTPRWTAPSASGSCQLSVTASDDHGAAVTAALSIDVVEANGNAVVHAQVNCWPVVSSFSGSVTLGPTLVGDLSVVAVDPDGDPLTHAWTSNCPGLAFDVLPPHGDATPRIAMPGPSDPCTVTVTVSDPPARGGHTTASLVLPPNRGLAGKCDGVTCQTGQACDPADGQCKPIDLCVGVTCPPASDPCHLPGTCTPATGICSPQTAKPCAAGLTCDPADGVCKGAPVPRPQLAKDLKLDNFQGLAIGADGTVYATGLLSLPTRTFDSFPLTSNGAGDAFLAMYPAGGGAAAWARNYGDGADQQPTAVAVTGDGTLAAIGQFSGSIGAGCSPSGCTAPLVTNTGTTPIDYLLGANAANGNVKWVRSFDEGISGSLYAVAANPTRNEIAVCGHASQAATGLVPGSTYGGGTDDVVIALLDSAGNARWSKQIGGVNEEECDAIAISDAGDVYAAGKYDGALTFTGTALPNPGSSFRRWIWVTRFDGATGSAVAQASFGSGAGNHKPQAIAVDAAGKLVLSGYLTNSLAFGGTSLVTAGGTDAFVAKLDPTNFQALWAVRLGGTGPDEARGVAVDSSGDVTAVGLFNGTTTGAAALVAPGSAASAAFALQLDGSTGATRFGAGWGDAGNNTVNANRVSVNRHGAGAVKDAVVFGGEFGGTVSFGAPTSDLTTTGRDAFLVFAKLLP